MSIILIDTVNIGFDTKRNRYMFNGREERWHESLLEIFDNMEHEGAL